MSSGHLFIVGFMGAGKSTVARLVADALGMPCMDLDTEIERAAGCGIAEIFESGGEQSFRDLEEAALNALEGREPHVVACGGGIVVRPANRVTLKQLGTVAYLTVTASEALARVGDAHTRPLLSGPSGSMAATALLEARETLYGSVADIEIDTVARTAEEVAAALFEVLEGERT